MLRLQQDGRQRRGCDSIRACQRRMSTHVGRRCWRFMLFHAMSHLIHEALSRSRSRDRRRQPAKQAARWCGFQRCVLHVDRPQRVQYVFTWCGLFIQGLREGATGYQHIALCWRLFCVLPPCFPRSLFVLSWFTPLGQSRLFVVSSYAYIGVHVSALFDVRMFLREYVHMYLWIHAHSQVYVSMRMYMSVQTYMRAYVHTHICARVHPHARCISCAMPLRVFLQSPALGRPCQPCRRPHVYGARLMPRRLGPRDHRAKCFVSVSVGFIRPFFVRYMISSRSATFCTRSASGARGAVCSCV